MFAGKIGLIKGPAAGGGGIITDGLELYLDAGISASYPGTGTTWFDLSGNGNNGTLYNTPTFRPLDGGGSFRLDGGISLGDWIGTPVGPTIDYCDCNATNQFSVCIWVQSDANDDGAICGAGGGIGTRTTFAFYTDSSNNVRMKIKGADTFVSGIDPTRFNQLTYTWDGTTGLAYLNASSPVNISIGTQSNQQVLYGIADVFEGGMTNYRKMAGLVSNTQIYNRALSAQEVTDNYNALAPRFGL